MRKNTKTYILLFVVLAIWGFLGFQIIGAFNSDEPEFPIVASNETFVPKTLKKRDTFSITAHYRDPFLGTIPRSKTVKKKNIKKVTKPEQPKKNITYSGSVAQNNSGKRMYFLTIDGTQHIIAKNETIADVQLLSGTTESVKVRYGNRTETIALSQ